MENEILDALKTMDAADVVSSKLASCYIVENGNRYLLFQLRNLAQKLKRIKKKWQSWAVSVQAISLPP